MTFDRSGTDRGIEISTPSTTPERSEQKERSLKKACLFARIAEEYRGKETIVLDLTQITPIVDYFVLTTGTSQRQMQAVADEINRLLKAEGELPVGIEGRDGSGWILQDYGDVVLHVFTSETRAVYDLEHLWADAPQVDWKSVIESKK